MEFGGSKPVIRIWVHVYIYIHMYTHKYVSHIYKIATNQSQSHYCIGRIRRGLFEVRFTEVQVSTTTTTTFWIVPGHFWWWLTQGYLRFVVLRYRWRFGHCNVGCSVVISYLSRELYCIQFNLFDPPRGKTRSICTNKITGDTRAEMTDQLWSHFLETCLKCRDQSAHCKKQFWGGW